MPNGLMNFETTNTSSIPGPRAIIITQIPCKALYVPWGKTNRCARSSQMNYMNRTHIVDMPAISLLLHTKKPGLKKKTLAGRCLRPTGHRKKIYSLLVNPRRPSPNELALMDASCCFPFLTLLFVSQDVEQHTGGVTTICPVVVLCLSNVPHKESIIS